MEKIHILEDVFIYKDSIHCEKESLLSEVYLNIDINKLSKYDGKDAVGIQSNIIINGFHIDKLFNEITYKIKNQFKIPVENPYIVDSWIYQSKNNVKDSNFHDHKYNPNKKISVDIQNEWTFTYYIQMPNNLKENDGYLTFGFGKNKKINKKISLLPKENDLLVFPAWLAHKPETNQNSTIDRIVIAGNFLFLDRITNYVKKSKSLY